MTEERKQKWNQRFLNRPNNLSQHESFLENHIDYLNKGSLLDFACGDGRNAIYLAQTGFKVTGADFSKEGLKRLRYFARIAQVHIRTIEADLGDVNQLTQFSSYDNIVIIRYKPAPLILDLLPRLLNPHGILAICTFNEQQAVKQGFSKKFCLREEELIGKWDTMELLKFMSFEENNRYSDAYIFQKISPL